MLTVMVIPAVKPLVLAEIVADPLACPVAIPTGLTDTSPALLDNQMTEVVKFCVEPSEYVPVAVSDTELPGANVAVVGMIARLVSVGEPV